MSSKIVFLKFWIISESFLKRFLSQTYQDPRLHMSHTSEWLQSLHTPEKLIISNTFAVIPKPSDWIPRHTCTFCVTRVESLALQFSLGISAFYLCDIFRRNRYFATHCMTEATLLRFWLVIARKPLFVTDLLVYIRKCSLFHIFATFEDNSEERR